MDLNRLPYIPLNFFIFQFSHPNRRMFILAMAGLLLGAGFCLFAYHNPSYWSLEVQEVSQPSLEQVEVLNVEQNYRNLSLKLNAFTQKVNYSASLLGPNPAPTYLFWALQLLAWALFLSAASYIRSRWVYLFYFIFTLYFYFTGGAEALFPGLDEATYRLLGGLAAIPFLGLAYLFQMNILRWKFVYRMLSILGLLLLYFGLSWMRGGWVELHKMSGDGFFFFILMTFPFIFFLSKDLGNLILAATNNRKDPRTRMNVYAIFGLLVAMLLTEFFMLNEYLGFEWIPQGLGIGLRPTHLLVFATVIAVFTSQNHFNLVRNIVSTNLAFSFIIISWGIVVLSHLGLVFSQGDYTYLDTVDRFVAVSFFFVGFGHALFIFLNHRYLLRDRVNVFFLLSQGPIIRFVIVWIIGLGGIVVLEGRSHWASVNRFGHGQALQKADQSVLKGDVLQATGDLELANALIINSVKAHYNLASMVLTGPDKINLALSHYEQIADFPYASLNAANILTLADKSRQAQRVLGPIVHKSKNPYLANNLGLLFAADNQADSAVTYLKQALLWDLNLSSVYSNLALLYRQYEKPEVAQEFFEASLHLSQPSNAALANALAYQLSREGNLDIPPIDPASSDDYALRFNYLLSQVQKNKSQPETQALARELAENDESADALILDAYLRFNQDSISQAISRIDYAKEIFPRQLSKAYYALGLAYLEREVPEMARLYFEKAGEAGDLKGFLYSAQMDLDLGRLDTARMKLSRLRVADPELWQPASKELALLLLAYNQKIFAQTEYDLNDLNRDDYIRAGRYADSVEQYIPALEAFRMALELDSTETSPYLELGKIYNRYGDARAVENLQYGLDISPENPALITEMARAHLNQEELAKAENRLAQLGDTLPAEAAYLLAQIRLTKKDTAEAINLLEALISRDPLYQDPILFLANIYRKQGDSSKGNALITQAVDLNTEQAEFWYYYAVFSREWNLSKDAGYGALRAIELSTDLQRRRAIEQEFMAEIKEVLGRY